MRLDSNVGTTSGLNDNGFFGFFFNSLDQLGKWVRNLLAQSQFLFAPARIVLLVVIK